MQATQDVRWEGVGRSLLVYRPENDTCVSEGRAYVLELLREAIRSLPDEDAVAVVVDCGPDVEGRAARLSRGRLVTAGLNWEHTLVRPGGRDSAGFAAGAVPTGRGDTYLVRLLDAAAHRRRHLLVDYSLPNVRNVSLAEPALGRRMLYVAQVPPLPEAQRPEQPADRRTDVLTTFCDPTGQPRRAEILRRLRAQCAADGRAFRNASDCFEGAAVRALYSDAKVVVNVRQTEDHHTLEELRLLWALACGAVVVSEDGPLRELLPYARFVVWVGYDDVDAAVRRVLARYEETRVELFGEGGVTLRRALEDMRAANSRRVRAALASGGDE